MVIITLVTGVYKTTNITFGGLRNCTNSWGKIARGLPGIDRGLAGSIVPMPPEAQPVPVRYALLNLSAVPIGCLEPGGSMEDATDNGEISIIYRGFTKQNGDFIVI